MKHSFLLTISLLLLSIISFAQSVPQGMKYQAVARDLKGQIIADRSLQLRITLYSDTELRLTQYTEIHKITTNQLGLFSLSIGQGFAQQGIFENVPWSEADIWMEVAIQADDDVEFITISDSRMLSVPYAFHAATASEIVGASGDRGLGSGNTGGVPAQVWVLVGNSNTDPSRDKLGTTDMKDLVIVTNNLERIRVDAHGDVNVVNNLNIDQNLYVSQNVQLNGEGGETINNGDFTVDNESKTYLTGDLKVDGDTKLNAKLQVEGATNLNSTLKVIDDTYLGADLSVLGATLLKSTLEVDGNTQLNANLEVDGDVDLNATLDVVGITSIANATQATSPDNGALVIDGGVGIAKDLYVGGDAHLTGNTTLASLDVTANSGEYVAAINNLNDGNGDGLVIRLGRVHPAYDPAITGDYLHVTNPNVEWIDSLAGRIRNWVEGGGFDGTDLLTLSATGLVPGTACNIINLVTTKVNESLDLPKQYGNWHMWDEIHLFGGLNLDADEENEIPAMSIPALTIPSFTIPGIDSVNCGTLPSYTLPNIAVSDVPSSLTSENQFISFRDKDDRELGSISAQSVTDWQVDFFDGVYFTELIGEVVGIDILSALVGAQMKFSEIASSYNEIGVTYNSGHGDYAEWLERFDHAEFISAGDIIGIRGGKITKDLNGAEQIMAVSTRPIILGNNPPAEKNKLGHNIAFMGQIPVKIIGPVTIGDYIIGNTATPGYGFAVHPDDLTLQQASMAVGRAWETKTTEGPKRVNTVVGVDNGAIFKILQQHNTGLADMHNRIDQLEAKMNMLVSSEVSANK